MATMQEGGNIFLLAMNSNQRQFTDHELKILFIRLECLIKTRIMAANKLSVLLQRTIKITNNYHHVALRSMLNALTEFPPQVLPILQECSDWLGRIPGRLVYGGYIMDSIKHQAEMQQSSWNQNCIRQHGSTDQYFAVHD